MSIEHLIRQSPALSLSLTILVSSVSVVNAGDVEPRVTPAQAIESVDWNRDGKVDRREYFDAMVYDHFTLDTNRDGFLSFDELKILQVGRSEFDAADADGSGRLGLHEYVNARFDDFELADDNGDGLLSLQEVSKFEHQLY